ncbi:hypothetical protein [Ekhidna sp.]|uniref:hypothetical protein n=1 Tax=Ekhidna sp. TaxID=2608089 RepID=UPI003BAD8C78
MKSKWVALIGIMVALLSVEYLLAKSIDFHPAFKLMVFFFTAQGFVLFRIDHWAPKEWKVQMSMVKIVIRLLSSMVFILVLIYSQNDQFNLVVQFIILYLIYMIFEIVEALTNLRRN